MISYDPLWKTMKKKNVTTYTLIEKYRFYKATIQRLRHNRNVTTRTLDDLCIALQCPISDVLEIRFELPAEEEKTAGGKKDIPAAN
ncbi:MAG: helix-turn-helix transcriptional regulator [Lachnospiraceae bacterium]|nr:helix-turn-helix transcriptional regulator [Lachnospiraceae bacterium]